MAKFKSLNIGDTVRVVSLADTDDRCGLNATVEASVGSKLKIVDLARSFGKGRVQLSNNWWYSPKGLEVVETRADVDPTDEPTGDDKGVFVTPETPEGTRVVYVGGADEDSDFEVGTVFKLRRHDGDKYPRVDYEDKEDYEYIRVCVKATGAEGVVVGSSINGFVAVLHDEASTDYHDGHSYAKDFVGIPDRIWYYCPSNLEIIGGVQ